MNNQQLEKFEITMSELKKYNDKGLLYLGKTLGNDLVLEWNNTANHTFISGIAGTGKSAAVEMLLHQLTQMTGYNYERIFITASEKLGDYTEFQGTNVSKTTGLRNQLAIFKHILNQMEGRENLFNSTRTMSIVDFNEKFPNNKLPHMVLVVEDWHESFNSSDKELSRELTATLNEILNIGRSSGCVVIVTSHSPLKSVNGITDKFQNHFVGFNTTRTMNILDSRLEEYMRNMGRPEGTFFFQTINLETILKVKNFNDTDYMLVQVPLIAVESPEVE